MSKDSKNYRNLKYFLPIFSVDPLNIKDEHYRISETLISSQYDGHGAVIIKQNKFVDTWILYGYLFHINNPQVCV